MTRLALGVKSDSSDAEATSVPSQREMVVGFLIKMSVHSTVVHVYGFSFGSFGDATWRRPFLKLQPSMFVSVYFLFVGSLRCGEAWRAVI